MKDTEIKVAGLVCDALKDLIPQKFAKLPEMSEERFPDMFFSNVCVASFSQIPLG